MEDGSIKLGDLGICRVLATTTGQGESQTQGTLIYMPPESFKKKAASFAADLWALGCILWQVMTRATLFKAEAKDENTDSKIRSRILNDTPGRLPKVYSKDLRFQVWRTLRKNPDERPTAAELLALDFFIKIFFNSAKEPKLVEPAGPALGTKTSIFEFSTFRFTDSYNVSGEDKNKTVTEETTATSKDASLQESSVIVKDIKPYLRYSESIKVSHKWSSQKC